MTWWWLVIVVIVLGLFGLYLSMTAGRLDALHKRIDTAELALDAHLLRRSSVALELATRGLLDPAGAIVVAEAAHVARTAADGDIQDPGHASRRARAESALSHALDATLDQEEIEEVLAAPGGAELMEELAASARRVQLSRRFLNDAVRACVQLRNQRMVRVFRLAGHASWPRAVDLDDSMPAGLVDL